MTSTSPSPRDALASLRIQRPDESPVRRRRTGRRWRWVVLGLLLVALVGAYFAITNEAIRNSLPGWLQVPEVLQSRVEVRIASPVIESGRAADALVVASGYLESRRQARIGARAPGRVEAVHVEEGSRVTKDQVLAVLEHADIDAALAAARASAARVDAQLAAQEITIAQAQRDHDRALSLWQNKNLSDAEYEKVKYAHEAALAERDSLKADQELAQARIRESEQVRENMFIRAPFDGTVISKDAEVGESIMPGGMGEASGRGSAVTIADLTNLEVDCDVKEDFISRVTEGQAAEIAIDAVPDRRYHGRVRKIIPMGDRASATIKVKVEITDADSLLFPDMSGTVYFLPTADSNESIQSERRMFVPSGCLLNSDQQTYVWLVDLNNRVRQRSVTIGSTRDGRTEILDGLESSDRIVVDPPELDAGQLVKPREN
jgi:RND family efflux transporter MFP subunit